MIPLERVKQIIDTYETLEKSLSSGDIDKKDFVKKSKEYSSIGEVISEARGYVGLAKEKKDLEKIINEKGNDKEMIKLAEKELEQAVNQAELLSGGIITAKEKVYGVHKDGDRMYIAYGMLYMVYGM